MMSYLLVYQYGFSQKDAGLYAARLGWYNDIALIPSEFLLGTLNDIIGRKKLIVCGVFLTGVFTICESLASKFFPWLVILYIGFGVSCLPIIINPLQADYLSPKTMGASGAINQLFSTLGQTISTSGAVKM